MSDSGRLMDDDDDLGRLETRVARLERLLLTLKADHDALKAGVHQQAAYLGVTHLLAPQ